MLIKSQFYFILKVFFISTIFSFFIKYGLNNWLINEYQNLIALFIILSPVLILLIILLLKQNRISQS